MTIARVAPYTIPAVDGQFQLDDFLFGPGTSYTIREVTGLDLPAIRSADAARSLHHGSFGSMDTSDVRDVGFVIMAEQRVGDPALAVILDAIGRAFRPRTVDVPLTFRIPGAAFTMLSLGRPRNCNFTVKPGFNSAKPGAEVVARFTGLDPLLYSADVVDALITAANAGIDAGLSFGVYTGAGPYPLGATFGVLTGISPLGATFGSDSALGGAGSGFYTAVNLGNEPTAPVTTIYGPADTPWIQLVETGQVIQLNIVLGSSDVLELDHDQHTVYLNGVANRQSAVDLSTSWWVLPPGSSTIHFRTVGPGAGSAIDVKWRHAKWTI